MRVFLVAAAIFVVSGSALRAGQSPSSDGQSNSASANVAASSSNGPATTTADKPKSDKKVWTNEEIANVGGDGAVSVVGKNGGNTAKSPSNAAKNTSGLSGREMQAATYREQLRKLNISLATTEKKIAELQAFKGDNSSPSGGINVRQRYYMETVGDQVKELEEKNKKIKAQIDAVQERARKNGFEPGLLR